MDSVISQEVLNSLLASMSNSISISKVEEELTKASKFDSIEKNGLYHGILFIIKNNSAKEAALLVSQEIENLIENRITSTMDSIHGAPRLSSETNKKIKSPIFHRVG